MKQVTVGIFEAREDAEKAVNNLHGKLGLRHEDISYVYRNTEGETEEVNTRDVASDTPTEGATKGAVVGGALGAAAGIAAVAGAIPALGPILVAGPLVAALGITGAIGSTVAAAATGAAAGGVVGALVAWGVDTERAQRYEDHVRAGNILVAAHADANRDVKKVLQDAGAVEVQVYGLHMA